MDTIVDVAMVVIALCALSATGGVMFSMDTIVDGVVPVIAFCALGATIWQVYTTRKHNKLSVRPWLETKLSGRKVSTYRAKVEIKLTNHGIGPAIIKNFVPLWDGEEVLCHDDEAYTEFLKEKFQQYKNVTHEPCLPNVVIPSGESITLLSVEYDVHYSPSVPPLDEFYVRIDYQSIYQDETFTYDSRAVFGR